MKKIITIDQGTTSTRAILFDETLQILRINSEKIESQFPKSGWVEQNPSDIIASVIKTVKSVIDNDVVALGITNQRETVVMWDRESGIPIYNAIVWQDRRTDKVCKDLKLGGYQGLVEERTGLFLDPYFSATKIGWLLDNVENARQKAEQGKLAFGTIDSFVLWHLTEGKVHATDITNASRTMLFNIYDKKWDDDLLDLFDIPQSILPVVNENIADFSETFLFGKKIPIKAMIGDQQAAAVGQGCFKPGMVKATFGTGCFVMMNTGQEAHRSESNLITTIAYTIDGFTTYAKEGSLFNVGTTIDWMKNNLNLIESYNDLNKIKEGTNNVIFVPAFTGLGAPYWNSSCRGAIFGLERDTDSDDLIQAALKSIAFQVRDLLSAMQSDHPNKTIKLLKVDGGVSQNDWLLQKISDQLRLKVERPINVEASAFGVACLLSLSLGVFKDFAAVNDCLKIDKIFEPENDTALIDKEYERWTEAIKKLLS